jgi:hypothetical protein
MKPWLVLIAAVLLFGAPVQASIFQYTPVGGYECAEDMSTDDCFSSPTATGWQGPTVLACQARGSRNQRCRNCTPKYSSSGQPEGYSVCSYVSTNGACDCTPSGVNTPCTANTASSCSYSW